MPIQIPFNIKKGIVVTSSPNTFTCEVREDSAIGSSKDTITCNLLQSVYSSKEDAAGFFLPESETSVLFITDITNPGYGTILGFLPETSAERLDPSTSDPLARQDAINYKGNLRDEVLPGDYLTRIGASSVTLTDSNYKAKSGTASVTLGSVAGNSYLKSTANTVQHDNSLFSLSVSDPGGTTSPRMDMDFFLQGKSTRGSLSNTYTEHSNPTMSITSSVDKPLAVKLPEAGITIDSSGRLILEGKTVVIKSSGKVQTWGSGAEDETLQRYLGTDIHLETTQDITLRSQRGHLNLEGIQSKLVGEAGLSLEGAKVSITANDSREGALPGVDQTMLLNSVRGGIEIRSGLAIPNDSSITKPGIAIESDGGGDIHIRSNPTAGSAFSTGTIVLDAALPASTSGSGGVGNYGVVLNSPSVLLGGYIGVPDTPKGSISPYPPPAPPVIDGPVKHFSMMTIHYPALLAAGAAGLGAAFPITAGAAVSAYTGLISSALTAMSSPSVGRPTSVHLGGI